MVSEFNIFHTQKSYRENTGGGPGLQWYLGDFRDLSMYVVFLDISNNINKNVTLILMIT